MPRKLQDVSIDLTTGQVTTRDIEVPDGADPREVLQQAMHDCPQCQAARAAGEVPIAHGGDIRDRHRIFTKRPRWRTRKRG
jgi:hypothetical protein